MNPKTKKTKEIPMKVTKGTKVKYFVKGKKVGEIDTNVSFEPKKLKKAIVAWAVMCRLVPNGKWGFYKAYRIDNFVEAKVTRDEIIEAENEAEIIKVKIIPIK